MPVGTRTKILATIGPSSASKAKLSELIDAGADAFRVNFSHGTYEEHKERIKTIRDLEKEKGKVIAILADMQGPKLRVGNFKEEKVWLEEGQTFTLDMKDKLGDNTRVCLPHEEIFAAIKVGDKLLVNDGYIVLEVIKASKTSMDTIVKVGGYISSHKGVNLPNTTLNISAVTEKDKKDIKFALQNDVDWIGLSFVQRVEDIIEVKKLIKGKAKIIAKLEKPSAINDLDNIVKESDAIMVARGDLGVECPLPTVPVLQKRIIKTCRFYAKPVIVATQMLESMIVNPTPTRAEVSDVATAVYDGADTVMLSAETAAGKYPIEAVKMMNSIINQVESDPLFFELMKNARIKRFDTDEANAITFAASELAGVLKNVKAIVSFSSSGFTTMLTAKERPSLPILAMSPDIKVARQMVLVWGVKPYVNKESFEKFTNVEKCAVKYVKKAKMAKEGDQIIITAGFPFNIKGHTNLLHSIKVK